MYRPTVRYSNAFKEYVDEVFHATRLDRNQIFRLALFTAAHNEEFKSILRKYKRKDVLLPHPKWTISEQDLWKEQNYTPIQHEKPPLKQVKLVNTGGIHYSFD